MDCPTYSTVTTRSTTTTVAAGGDVGVLAGGVCLGRAVHAALTVEAGEVLGMEEEQRKGCGMGEIGVGNGRKQADQCK